MSTFWIKFYDPNSCHLALSNVPHVLYLRSSVDSICSIVTECPTEQALCICCRDPSEMVNKLQSKRGTLLIYLCRSHGGGRETDPTYGSNVHDDVVFDSNSDWKSELMEATMELARRNESERTTLELLELSNAEAGESYVLPKEVEGQEENISSDTPDDDRPGEET